jgi:hypothetical protein
MKSRLAVACAAAGIAAVTAAILLWMGRSPLGPDGRFGLWEGDVWSRFQSQRLLDPYLFSHVAHGFLFYGLLFLTARRVPVRFRFLAAIALEGAWEILENSPLVIDRYRTVTMALGYVGDSVLNSMSDLLMAGLGFLLARRLPTQGSLALVLAMELGTAFWIRDNLALNIVMLVHPVDAIREWQSEGRPR